MKKLLTILCLVLLVSCSPPPEVPSNQLVERQGVTYEVDSTTPFTGISVRYYEGNYLEYRKNYKDGKEDGPYESYHENSELWMRGNFKDGKYDGLWEYFDDERNLTKTENYKDGVLQE